MWHIKYNAHCPVWGVHAPSKVVGRLLETCLLETCLLETCLLSLEDASGCNCHTLSAFLDYSACSLKGATTMAATNNKGLVLPDLALKAPLHATISKKNCFSNALRHTLVVLEMH